MDLPTPASLDSFERPNHVFGDPTTIKTTWLRRDLFTVDITSIGELGVKAKVIRHSLVRRRRICVSPDGFGGCSLSNDQIVVVSRPFELTEAPCCSDRPKIVHLHIFRGKIIGRRVTGLQNPVGPVGQGNLYPCKYHPNLLARFLKPGWAWIVPDALLSRTWWNGFWMTHKKPKNLPGANAQALFPGRSA